MITVEDETIHCGWCQEEIEHISYVQTDNPRSMMYCDACTGDAIGFEPYCGPMERAMGQTVRANTWIRSDYR